ncbi:MAG: TylF/MycF/NovP-related O-methyltransferase [Candidatus Omnitrophota bacterium]
MKPIHLFDTFQGMPKTNKQVDYHVEGDFHDTSLPDVQQYLHNYRNTKFYKGLFPNSANSLPQDTRFSFVHLDVDIYESTYAALEFFYSRLNRGGCLISHDYSSMSCPGVKKAFDDFFKDKPEKLIPLWKSNVLMIKCMSL